MMKTRTIKASSVPPLLREALRDISGMKLGDLKVVHVNDPDRTASDVWYAGTASEPKWEYRTRWSDEAKPPYWRVTSLPSW